MKKRHLYSDEGIVNLLVTGFEPFGLSDVNPSEQAARALSGERLGRCVVTSAILPVDMVRGPQMLLNVVGEIKPDAVLCLGEAGARPAISIERIAVNLLDFRIPDNSGNQVMDIPIDSGGPAAYFATLPVREMCEAIKAAGVPVELSLTAGSFLCNQVMYTLLHTIARQNLPIQGGFIHLPSLPEQAAKSTQAIPSMSLETSLRGLKVAIAVL